MQWVQANPAIVWQETTLLMTSSLSSLFNMTDPWSVKERASTTWQVKSETWFIWLYFCIVLRWQTIHSPMKMHMWQHKTLPSFRFYFEIRILMKQVPSTNWCSPSALQRKAHLVSQNPIAITSSSEVKPLVDLTEWKRQRPLEITVIVSFHFNSLTSHI